MSGRAPEPPPRSPQDRPGLLPEDGRRAARTVVVWPSRLLVALVALAFAAGLRVPETVQYLPFAASLALFGLPHGALDHLVPARLAGRDATARDALGVALLYAGLGGAVVLLWFVAPVAAFVLFVSVTVLHWGAGDLHALVCFGPAGLGSAGRASRASFLISRGLIPMLVPLLAFPDVYRAVAADATGLFGAGGVSAAFSPSLRLAVALALAGAVLAAALLSARDLSGARAPLLAPAAETALLLVFFAVVPPVLAVGLYFTLWHAPQHVARLMLLDGASAGTLRAGRPLLALTRFFRGAAPLTLAAVALLAGLYIAVPVRSGDAGSLLALYLVLVSALTVPHTVVVSHMDRRQGVWNADGRPPPAGSPVGP